MGFGPEFPLHRDRHSLASVDLSTPETTNNSFFYHQDFILLPQRVQSFNHEEFILLSPTVHLPITNTLFSYHKKFIFQSRRVGFPTTKNSLSYQEDFIFYHQENILPNRQSQTDSDERPPYWVPMMYSKRHLPDIEQWCRAVAPTSSRGGIVLV